VLLVLGACGCASGGEGAGGDREPNDAASNAMASDALSEPCEGRGQSLAGLSVDGDGDLSLAVVAIDPDPPVVGDNSWRVELLHEDEPLVGVADDILVSPRMPDHGHGTPVSVGVSEPSEGVYRLEPVNTFMPGYWEIDVLVEANDAQGSVLFGICVE
jgi:hypothetical protein